MLTSIDWNEVFDEFRINTSKLIAYIILIALTILITELAIAIVSHLTRRVIDRAKKHSDDPRSKGMITLMTLLNSILRFVIYLIALTVILNKMGYGSLVSNALTFAGIGALVLTVGAQSVISDLIAGIFILFEKQFAVGDFVKINEFSGTVTALAMRCTSLRSATGEQITINNGQIKTIINYSVEYNLAVIDIPTPYEQDTEKMISIIKEEADRYYDQHQDICFDKPSVSGITSFADNGAVISVYIKAKERNHYTIQNELRRAIKKRFDAEGLEIGHTRYIIKEN